MKVTIWHNPRCSKSRETLKLLQDQGVNPVVRLYLETPPSGAEIADTAKMLGVEMIAMMRSGEKLFKELGLKKTDAPEVLLDAMQHHPILIERPIVLSAKGARIGRPPEKVFEIL